MSRISASVTVHVEIFDAQGMWDQALEDYDGQCIHSTSDQAKAEFIGMCGPRDAPDIGAVLQMIFDPGESPAGISIQDSVAEVHA